MGKILKWKSIILRVMGERVLGKNFKVLIKPKNLTTQHGLFEIA